MNYEIFIEFMYELILHIFQDFSILKHIDQSRPYGKLGHGQPSVTIYIYFVVLKSTMLHAEFQDHQTSGSKEDFSGFTIYRWLSWSCVLPGPIIYKLLFPFTMEAAHEIWPSRSGNDH